MTNKVNETKTASSEILLKGGSGMSAMITNIIVMLITIGVFVMAVIFLATEADVNTVLMVTLIVVCALYFSTIGPILFCGLKILRPNESYVFTLFGRYYGTLKGAGFYWVNPFCTAVNPAAGVTETTTGAVKSTNAATSESLEALLVKASAGKKVSLKVMTLSNDRQKINDQLGNPIVIGIVVIWKVVNTAKAVFDVDNYKEYLSIQCDSALRNIVRLYPYDSAGTDNESSLRGSSMEVAEKLRDEIQAKVDIAGLEIIEARITHLSYAEEIAAVMLQRQQASAIIDAKSMIVEAGVSMVEMALNKLGETNVVELDEERKAAMVSNLLVVLCGGKDAQPVVNSGSLY
ncbi:MAG: SPFH domain-containing protein [Oscillospiraceae bacterium]|nr:SPFH domain-containing protein [Oscillospiraceae bacterium]